MYIEDAYRVTDLRVISDIIRDYPFAALVTLLDEGIEANHIPLLLQESADGTLRLRGHIAKANPLWRKVRKQTEALAIFQGPDAYISPSWYPSKQLDGKVVPTWNYIAIHFHGTLQVIQDPHWIMDQWNSITNQQEQGIVESWHVDDAPKEFIDKVLLQVMGVEVLVRNWYAKFKISQMQSEDNKIGVLQGLAQRNDVNDSNMASWVKSII